MKKELDSILATTRKNWKEIENEKTRGKKRYQERLAEELEAEQMIKDYQEQLEKDTIDHTEHYQIPEQLR